MDERSEPSRVQGPGFPEDLDVEGRAGEVVVLPIAVGPATGHVWRLELPDGVKRIDDGPERPLEPSERLGGASGGYLRVTAARGEHVLFARLARPWQTDRPVRVVR